MLHASLSRPRLEDPAFAGRWRALAAAGNASPFQSWTWTGCLAAERFPNPLLVETRRGDTLVGMALFNHERGFWTDTLHLHESGNPALDAIFIEHNGAIAAPERRAAVMAATLQALHGKATRINLSGLDDERLQAVHEAGGIVVGLQTRVAPYVRLDPATPYPEQLSRNTRAQLRRSDRSYANAGPIIADRASTIEQAHGWLGHMLELHVETWRARGTESPFASPAVQRFHYALIDRGVPTGEVDLLRIAAGPRLIGYLLNLRADGRIAAYQSGFDYAGAVAYEKPGYTSHHAAIEYARAQGATEYDFLAGDAQYKRSLSTDIRNLHWLTWKPRPFLFGLEAPLRRILHR